MANTINIPRSHLVMGFCLPLAVLVGYVLAEPMDSGSLGVIVFVLVILATPLLFLLAVVLITAFLTGGIGFRSLGGERYGGRGYLLILAAVVGFFAFTSRHIPAERAGLYLAMFFLTSLTPLIGTLTENMGPKFVYLHALFSIEQPSTSAGFDPIQT